jgi:hypothetical protein
MLKTLSKNPWKKVTKNTNQQDRNDPHRIMKLAKEEWNQTDTQLAKYSQNSEWMSDWNCQSDIVWEFQTLSGRVRHCPVGGL